jgi:hypothetical protein
MLDGAVFVTLNFLAEKDFHRMALHDSILSRAVCAEGCSKHPSAVHSIRFSTERVGGAA